MSKTILSIAKSTLGLSLVAATTMGCIIVIPPAKKGDPFQPPSAQAENIKKGETHKIRLTCGQRVVFKSPMVPMDNLIVDFNAVNLQPASQLETAAMRMTWRGPGVSMDMPINAGDQSQRNTKGNITINGGAGQHEMTISMENKPACGPVNLTLAFK